MKHLMALALIVLAFLQATGLDLALAPPSCEQDCTGDGPDGSCAPLCQECTCCPALRSCHQAGGTLSSPIVAGMAAESKPQPLPRSAEPSEIFHIPKPALA